MFLCRYKKSNQRISINSREQVVLISMHDLVALNPKNWSRNRLPDDHRIHHIQRYVLDNELKCVPGLIYIWKTLGSKPEYFIYDGIHRYEACKHLENIKCLIRIFETKESEIIQDFIQLNKSISVPYIYIEDTYELKRKICENVAQKLCSKYPRFVSSSRKPFNYNFNRDIFMDFLADLDIDFTKPETEELLWSELMGANQYAKDYVKRSNIQTPKKCHMYDFFLFYITPSLLKNKLENSLNKN